MKFLIIVGLLCSSASLAFAQEPSSVDESYVVAPAEDVFLAVAAQPDCPLRIEDAQVLLPVGKGVLQFRYKLSNRGNKPIHYFTIAAWNTEGGGGTLSGPPPWDGRVTDRLLNPGETVAVAQDDLRVVPLDSALRTRMKLSGKLHAVVILLVDQIRFADGSKYDAQVASRSLIDFLTDRAK